MNTPVLDSQGKLLGDLILYRSDHLYPEFRRPVMVPLPTAAIDPGNIPSEMTTVHYVSFTNQMQRFIKEPWASSMMELRVVVADKPDLLPMVQGYRNFVEIWGTEVPRR